MATAAPLRLVPGSLQAPRVLVADDERSMRELLAIVLRREGYDVVLAESGRQAVASLEREAFDLVISDLRMPDLDGVEVLQAAKRCDADIEALMITAYASYETAVEAMRLGACDYLTKPFDVDELRAKVSKAIERRRLRREPDLSARQVLVPAPTRVRGGARSLPTSGGAVGSIPWGAPDGGVTGQGAVPGTAALIGRSEAMLSVFKLIGTVAPTASTVLISGESGTGKEMAARTIHQNSPRRDRPFVAINCGAFPETLLESELFGHVRGAFTGADAQKKGLLEVADKGTVFLDEIGEMSAAMQVKLLRVLQERRFRRVGGTDEIETDIRVIAATNRDLSAAVAEGTFREDLYYRLDVIPVRLLPLRERRDDIPLLAEHFVAKYARQLGKVIRGVTPDALAALDAHDWPGNIRELENAMERAVALERTAYITPESLPDHVRHTPSGRLTHAAVPSPLGGFELPEEGFDLERHVADIERHYIAKALERAGGVKTKAAELLGMSFRSFRYYARKYNLG